ncbi:MAG: hypothetical protein KDA20_11655, partial [Phycisphaerales bacterium]|nr:hypothetical protein [Phycisphaerales bacterium]
MTRARSWLGTGLGACALMFGAVCATPAGAGDDAGALGAFDMQVDGLPGASAAAYGADGALAVLCPDAGEIVLLRDGAVVKRVPIPIEVGIGPAQSNGDIAALGEGSWVLGGAGGLFVVGGEPPRAKQLGDVKDVRGVAVSEDGTSIAVAHWNDWAGQVVVVSAEDGHVERTIESSDSVQLHWPRGVAFDESGALYLVDELQCALWKFDAGGSLVWTLGEYGDQLGFFSAPGGIAVEGSKLYLAEGRNHRIAVIDSEQGALLDAWGTHAMRPREGQTKLHYPNDVAISPDGKHIAVCEPWEDRVQLFRCAAAGETLERTKYSDLGAYTHFGDYAATDGQLLAVLQPDSHRVLMYDIGRSHAERSEPVLIGAYGEFGARSGLFREPGALALDASARRLYVHDRGNERLCALAIDWSEEERLRFNPTLLSFARSVDLVALARAQGLGQVIAPSAMVVLDDGQLLAADPANGALFLIDAKLSNAKRVNVRGVEGALAPIALAARSHGGVMHIAVTDAERGAVYVGALKDGELELHRAPFPLIADPRGVALMNDGSVVATDRVGHQVWVARSVEGDWAHHAAAQVRSQGSGIGVGQVVKPRACVVTDDGRLIVVDRGNHRLEVWSPEL